jgi:hypothetical protein
MKYVPLTTTDPGSFAYTEGQTRYNERLAHEILKHAAAMAAEGYEITFEEPDTYSYQGLWNLQTASIYAVVNALNAKEDPHCQTYANELQELASIPFYRDNYILRSRAISAAFLALGEADSLTVDTDGIVNALEKFHTHLTEEELTNLWKAQNATIQEQNEYLLSVKQQLQEKREKLPEREETKGLLGTLWDNFLAETVEQIIEMLIIGLLKYIFTLGDIATKVVAFLSIVTLLALKDLIDQCTEGEAICDKYIEENSALIGLTPSEYAYELRLKITKNHNDHIANLLTDIHSLEETASTSGSETSGDMAELIQAVKDLQANGQEFWYKDGSKYILSGGTSSGTE